MNCKEDLKLYLVTDCDILKNRNFYEAIEESLKGGVTMLQLRDKKCSDDEFLEKAIKLRKLCDKYNVKFIINDRVEIVNKCNADGLHIGQSDISTYEARNLIGDDKILGVSARNLEEAIIAKNNKADYIGVGAMFKTSTKLDAVYVPMNELEVIKENLDIPIVAIGGINLDNVDNLIKYDLDGYAIISAILSAENIYEETLKWSKKLNIK